MIVDSNLSWITNAIPYKLNVKVMIIDYTVHNQLH